MAQVIPDIDILGQYWVKSRIVLQRVGFVMWIPRNTGQDVGGEDVEREAKELLESVARGALKQKESTK